MKYLTITCLFSFSRIFVHVFASPKDLNTTDAGISCDDNVTFCQNGSKCIPILPGFEAPLGRKFRCDCSPEVTKKIALYAGYECEYSAKETCIIGPDASKSFCTNGDCKMIWRPGNGEETHHKGCECYDGFEGDFCEYIDGLAPKVVRESSQADGNQAESPHVLKSVVALGIALCFLVGMLIVRYRVNSQDKSIPPVETMQPNVALDKEII